MKAPLDPAALTAALEAEGLTEDASLPARWCWARSALDAGRPDVVAAEIAASVAAAEVRLGRRPTRFWVSKGALLLGVTT